MLYVRKEKKNDYRDVERMIGVEVKDKENATFHYQLCCLRGSKEFNKELTFVVEDKGDIVGFITIVSIKLDYKGLQSDMLYLLPPIVKKEYLNQGVMNLLVTNALDEAKYLGYGNVLFNGDESLHSIIKYPFKRNVNIVDTMNKQNKNIYVIQLKNSVLSDLKGDIVWPSAFKDFDESIFQLYEHKLFDSHARTEKSTKVVTRGAFVFALLFVIAAVVLTILRFNNIVSPAIGIGSIIISIGGCLGSIGVSNMVSDKKIMGWIAIALAAIVIVLGVLCAIYG